jgi:sodium-dependent dicarboxylate transporter 2/3/5
MTTTMVKRIGLCGGPLLGLLCYALLPSRYATDPGAWVAFTHAGRATLALMVWMAGWWLTEAVDIEATALLPIVTFPLLGIAPLTKVLQPYAADVFFLFMGGFIIGLAIARWGLDRRIAFFILRLVGARPGAIVGGFMAVTALHYPRTFSTDLINCTCKISGQETLVVNGVEIRPRRCSGPWPMQVIDILTTR